MQTQKERYVIYRLGVLSLMEKTAQNIQISLIKVGNFGRSRLDPEPQIVAGVLSPMRSLPKSLSSFTVHPSTSPANYVDILRWYSKETRIEICFHNNIAMTAQPLPNKLKAGSYTLLLAARGENIPETEWYITISAFKHKLEFKFHGQPEEIEL